ncbi:BACON domain-containing protein [Nitrospira sp. BLG_1]|uniref:BACON domain-containing protein n=1 Tax=Nitrospira sp. BLG_1 TaxID=3395883 RepID=UPI0039BD1C4A
MRQTIRQLLLFPIGFCMVSSLFEPMNVPTTSAFAATGDPPITTASPTPHSRLMSRMPTLRRLTTPPTPTPAIALNSLGFSFSSQQGNSPPPPQVLTVSNRGGGILNWNATTSTSWLTLSPSSGTGNGTVTISPVLGSLGVGTHTGTITLSAPGAQPVAIPVTFSVTPAPVPPAIGVSSTSVSFTAQQSGSNPAPQLLNIRNTGGGTLSWTASDNAAWLTLSSTTGTGNGTVTISPVLGSLGVGTHTGTITLSAPGAQPVAIPVTFSVTPAPTSITLSPSSLTYTGVSGGSNPTNQSVNVTANSNWTASVNAAWLKLSTTSGSGNGTIIASVDLGNVSTQTNTATISVTAGNTTRTVGVTLTLSPGSLTLSSNSLAFTATQGLANPASKTIAVQSNGSWTATKTATWLSLSQTSGSANGTITANVDTSKAIQGENQATVTVTSGTVIKTVTITLTLNAPSSSSATLTWKANSETDLAGYKVYRSTISGKYDQGNVITMLRGNVTSYQATGLQFGKTYFFVVTAFDIAGNESGYSNEVSKSVY